MNQYLMCALLACLATGASAQQARPQRYVDAEGVEIIQNRDPSRAPAIAPARAGEIAPARAGAVRSGGATTGAVGPADPKLQVSAAEQSARDRDRVAILREELAHETRKFEAASKELVQTQQSARSQPQTGDALRQLKEVLHMHQKNIESLTAELRRTGTPR